ncbi:MAG: ABC transporter permease [Candidatus Latescibacter sp.]|nr:ABC transporter permease [Candidatus Latescibacter sp.]
MSKCLKVVVRGVDMETFEFFVAWRYLLTRKKTGFISIISIISIIGVAVGVGALIIVLSLMNGFTKELRTRLVGMDGHVWVSRPLERGIPDSGQVLRKLKSMPGVAGVSPFCSYETVATPKEKGKPVAVMVRGVDRETVDTVSDIRKYVTIGDFDFSPDDKNIPGVVLGQYVASALGNVSIGDYIYLYGEVDMESLLRDNTLPAINVFRIRGLFNSGYYEYDNSVVLIDIHRAQKILNLDGKISGISLKLNDMFKAEKYTGEGGYIEKSLGGYPFTSISWIERNRVLFKWMKLEKWAAFIVLSLIIIVAAFNIVSSQIMMVMDKTREIGILKSMGASNRSIMRIFVYQGAFVGVVGTAIGGMVGIMFSFLQDKYQLISLPSDVYFISAVPMDMQLTDILSITAVALFLCWFSSYYPAKKAAQLAPVDAIRSE